AGVLAAALLGELHHLADVLLRRQDRGLDVGLADLGDPGRVGHVARRVDLELLAVRERDLEADRRHRRQQVEVVLALEALAHDVHVQQPEEADAEAEPEGVPRSGPPCPPWAAWGWTFT